MNELQQLLLSGKALHITTDGFRQAMLTAFPLSEKAETPGVRNSLGLLSTTQLAYLASHTWYQLETHEALKKQLEAIRQDNSQPAVTLTDEYANEELPENSIAYHRVWGTVMSEAYWFFSSKQLAADLMAAEDNPQITCHFLHVNSPGGDAWFLDRLSEALRACTKPIVTLYEHLCCSAGYYIACHGSRVYALTANDYVGCIGTMCSFYDFQPYFEKLGIKLIEAKADKSDLKNKTFDDLRKGKPAQYVDDFLNPLNEQFLACVRSQRSGLAELGDDAPVLRGETYLTAEAITTGLCDGTRTFAETVAEAVVMGAEYADAEKTKRAIYNIL
jgi:ClpP class serine protease